MMTKESIQALAADLCAAMPDGRTAKIADQCVELVSNLIMRGEADEFYAGLIYGQKLILDSLDNVSQEEIQKWLSVVCCSLCTAAAREIINNNTAL